MRPESYADHLRQYGTYARTYGNKRLSKIACGPAGDDYEWTDVLMKNASGHMAGLSLHHYAFNDGNTATDFDEHGWFDILKKSLMMEDYVTRHGAIMEKYDPKKKVALVVDEWGTWYGVEPGTNPRFLFQQNTLRDAITAACNLNIFNNQCERVRMANIAQMVNVLQAMILTNDEKLILTPTYHVFDLFKVHQDALWVQTDIESADYVFAGQRLPAVNCSASIDEKERMHISLCNIDPNSPHRVSSRLVKFAASGVSGQILTAKAMNAHNSFDKPDVVVPQKFSDVALTKSGFEVTLPPMSVVVLELDGQVELTPAVQIKSVTPGIKYNYYEGRWTKLPVFDSLSATRSGTVGQFEIPGQNSEENFAVQYSGYIRIPADGLYTFTINSDDGADLSINKSVIVDNDGRHAPEEQSGIIVLSAGYHRIEVGFFQAAGRKVLEVDVKGPGMSRQTIPAALLFHIP